MPTEYNIKKIKLEIEKLKGQLLQVGSFSKAIVKSELSDKLHVFENLRKNISEVKEILSDPNDGIIVKVNKNTEYRVHDNKNNKQREKIIQEFSKTCQEMKNWKSGVTKALWISFAAIVGIVIKLIFGTF
jgi:hypothetical protein